MSDTSITMSTEYNRKITIAAKIADDAWIQSGLSGMHDALRILRRADADPVIIVEVERMYHKQVIATA